MGIPNTEGICININKLECKCKLPFGEPIFFEGININKLECK